MAADYSRIWPFLVALLIVYSVYRRVRRTFGRQLLRPVRMGLRMLLLLAVGCLLLPRALSSAQFFGAELIGVLLGVAMGVWGAGRTRYSRDAGVTHYRPHTYTGIVVSLLFVGRLAYRIVETYFVEPAGQAADPGPAAGFAPSAMVRSPVTVGLLFVLIGYYVCYYGLVLWKSRHLRAEDLESSSASVS